jgi:hypothetical protein
LEDEIVYRWYIAERRRYGCPKLQIKIAGEEILALLDTGSEMSLLNENLYNKLWRNGLGCLELPTQHINLISAFNERSKRVKKQAMLEVNISDKRADQIVLLSNQLLTDAILGLDFLISCDAEISFPEGKISLMIKGEIHKLEMYGVQDVGNDDDNARQSTETHHSDPGLMLLMALNRPTLRADKELGQRQHTELTWILSGSGIVEGRTSEGTRSSSDGK